MKGTYSFPCIVLTLGFLVCHTTSSCISVDSLSLNTKHEPIIFTYIPHLTPSIDFVYPELGSRCEFDLSNTILHFGCLKNKLRINYSNGSDFECGNSVHTKLGAYVLNEGKSIFLEVCNKKVTGDSKLECSGEVIPTMRFMKGNLYKVGYEINPADFLGTYDIMQKLDTTRQSNFQARAIILSINEMKAVLNEDSRIPEMKKGSFFQNEPVDFANIYSKYRQFGNFLEQVGDSSVKKYFSDGNRLVPGKLISEDDLFYNSQQKSTFFYENTVPIWRSINEGNWKLIGNIIRQITIESGRDTEIFVIPVGTLQIEESKIVNLMDKENFYTINIPQMIVKVAVDAEIRTRGVVFHIFNDPYMRKQDAEGIMTNNEGSLCSKLMDCSDRYPKFLEANEGLTFCCTLENSEMWSLVKEDWSSIITFS